MGYGLFLNRLYTHVLRRRSILLKLVFLLCTVWLTVAFLLFTEQRNSVSYDLNDDIMKLGQRNGIGTNSREMLEVLPPQPLQRVNNVPVVSKAQHSKNNGVGPEGGEGGVLLPPRDIPVGSGPLYGEMGKPVVLPSNMTADVKKLVDEGWSKNAFNQYVSDLISLHRKLPDPRDEW